MKRQLVLILLFGLTVGVSAQKRDILVSSERKGGGEVTFWVENSSYIPYTVTLTFSKLTNTTTLSEGEKYSALVMSGRKSLLTLRPAGKGGVGFSYQYTYSKGDVKAKVDTMYTYLFPLAQGKTVRMKKLASLKGFTTNSRSHFTGTAFRTVEGDTITAARGGRVIDVQEQSASTDKTIYTATENYVEVCHKDGSIATYKLFLDGGVFVKPGDEVIPGQPLGIIGGSNYSGGSHLRFMLFNPANPKVYFVPCFYLSEGNIGEAEENVLYVSEHPEEIVLQELSKKQRKALGE